jgi:outer membrane protein assembly factor BamB
VEKLFSNIVRDLGTARTVVLIFASIILFILIAVYAVMFIVDILNPFEIKGSGIFAVEPEWIFETSETIVSTPVVYGDTIIVHTEKKLYALNASTRDVLWTSDSPGDIYGSAPPIAADGVVVVPEGSNPFAAFDITTGELLWRNCFLDMGEVDCGEASPGLYIDDIQSSHGMVFISDFSGDLTWYDIRTGTQLWKLDDPGKGGPLVDIDESTVYLEHLAPEDAVQLWAVDVETGGVLWRVDMDDVMVVLVAQDGILYSSNSYEDKVRAMTATQDGITVMWEAPVNLDGPPGSKGLYFSLDNDILFVAGNQLTAISIRDGDVLWRTGDHVGFMGPVIIGNIVLSRNQHLLYAFDKETGTELGQLSIEVAPGWYNVELNPAVYGNLVLVPVGAKQLAAYRLEILNP